MSGRIKLLKNGEPIAIDNDPPLGYEYESPSKFMTPYFEHFEYYFLLQLFR